MGMKNDGGSAAKVSLLHNMKEMLQMLEPRPFSLLMLCVRFAI
jgi:hypothetical protein